MRFSAPDPPALARSIAETRVKLATALQDGDALAVVEAAAELGGMLTTARMEAEAIQLLEKYMHHAEVNRQLEPAGWFWSTYATALQYCGRRAQADSYFV